LGVSPKTRRNARRLREMLAGRKTMLIAMQDHPDPDAVAAAGALRAIANSVGGIACSLAHGGIIGRAENRALVRYLGLNLRPLEALAAERFDLVALVDTQPGTGNNSLPPGVKVDMVVDHHPTRRASMSTPFRDIRRQYGATSTIMYEYMQALGVEADTPLATALCYGIRSDTQDLGRDSTQADMEAYLALYPLANKRALGRICREPEPEEYFHVLARGLGNARIYGHAIVAGLGEVHCPETVAEIADLLVRCETVDWSLAHGVYEGRIYLSLRTADAAHNAGEVMRWLTHGLGTGGGHPGMAGGQIPLAGQDRNLAELEKEILRRFLRRMHVRRRQERPLLT